MTTEIKVCGATGDVEVDQAIEGGADLVGLWWGVPGSVFSLSTNEVAALAQRFSDGRSEPCLVTFEQDATAITRCLDRTGIRVVQLHAFQMPGVVRALRREVGPRVRIIKVLHCTREGCLDLRYAASYVTAGVDAFILDAVHGSHIGSTGKQIPASVVVDTLGRLEVPTLVAGGLSSMVPAGYDGVRSHPLFAGIDVDSAARGSDGVIATSAVAALVQAWRPRILQSAGA